jgi:hypothetical protein
MNMDVSREGTPSDVRKFFMYVLQSNFIFRGYRDRHRSGSVKEMNVVYSSRATLSKKYPKYQVWNVECRGNQF